MKFLGVWTAFGTTEDLLPNGRSNTRASKIISKASASKTLLSNLVWALELEVRSILQVPALYSNWEKTCKKRAAPPSSNPKRAQNVNQISSSVFHCYTSGWPARTFQCRHHQLCEAYACIAFLDMTAKDCLKLLYIDLEYSHSAPALGRPSLLVKVSDRYGKTLLPLTTVSVSFVL